VGERVWLKCLDLEIKLSFGLFLFGDCKKLLRLGIPTPGIIGKVKAGGG
jgi:hypothetical protein